MDRTEGDPGRALGRVLITYDVLSRVTFSSRTGYKEKESTHVPSNQEHTFNTLDAIVFDQTNLDYCQGFCSVFT